MKQRTKGVLRAEAVRWSEAGYTITPIMTQNDEEIMLFDATGAYLMLPMQTKAVSISRYKPTSGDQSHM